VIHHHRDRLWLHEETRIHVCPDKRWDTRNPLDLGPVLGTLRLQGDGHFATRLRVRSRRAGDRIECLSGGHTRPVKDLLREAGIPPWLRASVPLLVDRGKVVAAAGCGIAQHFQKRLLDQRLRLHWRPVDETLCWITGSAPPGEVDRAD
jgi:tRNA(Ile)-lysidine synthase